jgi:hypothetical protein
MTANSATQDTLREYFEGKEALYFEKGALLARVRNVRVTTRCENPNYPPYEYAQADLEEIPTPGLPVCVLGYDRRNQPRPLRWSVGTNLTMYKHFGPEHWSGGAYAGWRMYFSPKLIAGIVELVAGFREEEIAYRGYWQVQSYLRKHQESEWEAAKLRKHGERMVKGLRAAIDAGERSGLAKGDVFAQVRKSLKLPGRRG